MSSYGVFFLYCESVILAMFKVIPTKHRRMPGDIPPAKEARQTTSPSKKNIEKCPVCLVPAIEGDIMECNCCETLHHCSCLKISSDQCKVLSSIVDR